MKRLSTRLPAAASKTRLDDFLAGWVPEALGYPVSRTKIRMLILSGSVYVNRHRSKNPSTLLFAGAVLEVYANESKLRSDSRIQDEQKAKVDQSRILFEDEWLIAVNKDPGIPTQPTVDPSRSNLYDLTKNFLKDQGSYLGLHHRLDRDTSGVLLFTKKEEANKGVAELFSKHGIQKTYHCLVWRSPDAPILQRGESFEIKDLLGRISPKNEIAKFGSVKSNGDPAHTFFKVLEVFRNAYWLEAQPKTGRTHQIRVHASERGMPILGDPLYFPKKVLSLVPAPRLMLHAFRLSFIHPMTSKTMEIEAPLPDDFMKVLGVLKP